MTTPHHPDRAARLVPSSGRIVAAAHSSLAFASGDCAARVHLDDTTDKPIRRHPTFHSLRCRNASDAIPTAHHAVGRLGVHARNETAPDAVLVGATSPIQCFLNGTNTPPVLFAWSCSFRFSSNTRWKSEKQCRAHAESEEKPLASALNWSRSASDSFTLRTFGRSLPMGRPVRFATPTREIGIGCAGAKRSIHLCGASIFEGHRNSITTFDGHRNSITCD